MKNSSTNDSITNSTHLIHYQLDDEKCPLEIEEDIYENLHDQNDKENENYLKNGDQKSHEGVYDDEYLTFKMRLWDYLIRNMNSAVDELYCMCELESSTSRCNEAARALASCREDFIKLIERIQMQSSMSSKSSLAWEVKKGSNGVKSKVAKALERMAKTTPPPIFDYVPPVEKLDPIRPGSPSNGIDDVTTRHQKLSLPRKPKRSPSETKLLSEQRLDTVTANKNAIESARLTRIRIAAERMQHVTSRNATSRKMQEDLMWAKLARADRLKEAHLSWIVTKAGSENTKVDEINFIQTLMHQDRKIELQQRLDHVAVRRENLIRQIKDKASLKTESIRAVAKAKEEQMELRLREIQKRHEGVQARRLKYQQERKAKKKRKHKRQEAQSLEASMERTMRQNAQRLRDRMQFLTCRLNRGAVHTTRSNGLQGYLTQIQTHVEEMNDTALQSVLVELLQNLVHDMPYDRESIAILAHLPTLQWASKASITTALRLLVTICAPCRMHVEWLLMDNLVLPLVDVLVWAFQHWDRNDVLLWALPLAVVCLSPSTSTKLDVIRDDIVRYTVNVGILFRIADRFALIAVAQQDDELFRLTVHYLCSLTSSSNRQQLPRSISDLRRPLGRIFKTTGLLGIISLLLSSFPAQSFEEMKESISPQSIALSYYIIHALNSIAQFDINWFQSAIGLTSNQEKFLHLMKVFFTGNTYESKEMEEVTWELLHLLGYFALHCPKHQEALRCSNILTILTTGFSFQYFIDPRLKDILFPTLIAIVWNDQTNTTILSATINPILLCVYLRRYIQAHQAASTFGPWQKENGKDPRIQSDDTTWKQLALRLPTETWNDILRFLER